jgi:hypothetical protein
MSEEVDEKSIKNAINHCVVALSKKKPAVVSLRLCTDDSTVKTWPT